MFCFQLITGFSFRIRLISPKCGVNYEYSVQKNLTKEKSLQDIKFSPARAHSYFYLRQFLFVKIPLSDFSFFAFSIDFQLTASSYLIPITFQFLSDFITQSDVLLGRMR